MFIPTCKLDARLVGGRNMHPECISSIANNCQDLRTIDLGFGNTTQQMLTDLVTSCPRVSSVNFEGCECADSEWIKTLCQFKVTSASSIFSGPNLLLLHIDSFYCKRRYFFACQIGRAPRLNSSHVRTSRMPSSAWKKKHNFYYKLILYFPFLLIII